MSRTMTKVNVMKPTPAVTLVSLTIGGDEYRVTHAVGSDWVTWTHSTDKRRQYRVYRGVACNCPAKTLRCKHIAATAALKDYL